MTVNKKESVGYGLIAALAAVLIVIWAVMTAISNNARDHSQRAESLKRARAVSVLPNGTEEAWFSYIDRRLVAAIRRHGDVLLVASQGDDILHATTFVSLNMPFQISCSWPLGADVKFGQGDDAVEVPIYGVMLMLLSSGAETEPQLGVDQESIAAQKLSENLCTRISVYMQKIEAPSSARLAPVAPGAAEYQKRLQAGFTKSEVEEWKAKATAKFKSAGFSTQEINEYWGDQEP